MSKISKYIFPSITCIALVVGAMVGLNRIYPDFEDDAPMRTAKAAVRKQLEAGKTEIPAAVAFESLGGNTSKVCMSIKSGMEEAWYSFYFIDREVKTFDAKDFREAPHIKTNSGITLNGISYYFIF